LLRRIYSGHIARWQGGDSKNATSRGNFDARSEQGTARETVTMKTQAGAADRSRNEKMTGFEDESAEAYFWGGDAAGRRPRTLLSFSP
jgi:hypothetical protein